MSITAKLEFNAAVFIPRKLSTEGNVLSSNIDNSGNRIFEFTATNLQISDSDSILTEIIGDAILGDVETTPMVLTDFKIIPDTIFAPIFPENGEFRLKICKEGGDRLLYRGSPIAMYVNPNPAGDEINIRGNVLEAGIHTIELMDVNGKSKILETWNSDYSKEFDFTVDISGYSTGMYYVVLRTPVRISVVPVFIVN